MPEFVGSSLLKDWILGKCLSRWLQLDFEAYVRLVLLCLAACWAPGDHHIHQDRAGLWFSFTNLETIPVGSLHSAKALTLRLKSCLALLQ